MKYLIAVLTAVGLLAATGTQAQNFQKDLSNLGSDVLNGPWVAGAGFEHSTAGTGANIAFGTISYNLVPSTNGMGFNSGPIIGYEDCWAKGQSQQNTLSGGWDVSERGHWFSFVGKTFLTNIVGTVTAYQLIATPRNGSSPVGAISGGAVSLDVAQLDGFHFQPTVVFNNRNGQPGFNGSFLGGALFITHNF